MFLEDFFSHIKNQYTNNLPFVAYRKPNDSRVKAMLQNTDALYSTQGFEDKGFVFAPFEDSSQTVLIPLEHSETKCCDFNSLLLNNSSQNQIKTDETDKRTHVNLVQKGIESIGMKHLQKVVLSRCEAIPFSENQFLSAFKKLLQNYPNAFVYCWYHPKVGLWLGATPETLIHMSGNRFKTMALAGTQSYKDSLEVTWNTKEKDEQQFVTDYIESCLKPYVNHLSVTEAKTVKAGHILHLQSNVSGVLNASLHTILKKLHPTPAVCGLPVNEAKAFILENESYNREYYTGFLGELNVMETTSRNTNRRNVENNAYHSVKTVTNLFVNLRCMQIKNNQALIYVGGGITKDSIPEHEWDETVSKAETMKQVLMS
ncbi:chorismate-binding protein [Psychroserpens ponticola]|uniref:Chorismate-binding protein n=1 Tax=Psychroserpens ponticola TaxID=2932268 RepID=A0ABY7S1U4_9FLAO|nr:chorismate-binding protein [Psychroserpens ponticola]WCO03353.1 chorismate-binding protein [Psychroserpens ponticola]